MVIFNILRVESKILENAIQNTQNIMEVIEGMKFNKIEKDVINECSSLTEIKVFFENYFMKSLVNLDYDWSELVQKIKKRIEESATLIEIIVNVKKLFSKIFNVKTNWIKSKGYQIFYSYCKPNIDQVIPYMTKIERRKDIKGTRETKW